MVCLSCIYLEWKECDVMVSKAKKDIVEAISIGGRFQSQILTTSCASFLIVTYLPKIFRPAVNLMEKGEN